MQTKILRGESAETPYDRSVADPVGTSFRVDCRVMRFCCGNFIEPRLAEIRCPNDPTLFIAVWRCPICGRITR